MELFHGTYKTYEFARHFHSVPAIGIVERGSMASYCRKEDHVLPTGTVLLLNAGEVHAPRPTSPDAWGFRVFYFEDSFFDKQSKAFSRDAFHFSKPFVQDASLSEWLLRLHRKFETNSSSLEVESSSLEIFARLLERHTSNVQRPQTSAFEKAKIKRVRDYMDANYGCDISLDDLAKIAQLSPYHLLRSFRSAVGLPPHAYLNQIRIEAGRHLLQLGHSIAEVATATGFVDQSHFTRHFKRIMGVTPGQYLPHSSEHLRTA
ncbi:AraC family transcriptional regulator [Edaphobacter paludis]|uniref:AraC family transcriptional regulator n=1 Tax=Edaphobacter paludis TaxID=3035702 RepID=A0AAU7CYC2_9BACT